MTKTIMILAIAAAFVAVMITSTTPVFAPPPDNPGQPFDAILQELDQIIATIGGTDTEVTNIEGKLDGTVSSFVTDIKTETDKIDDIKTETDKIPMIKNNQFVPFKEDTTDDVVCDQPDVGSSPSFKTIRVQSSGTTGTIIVTGAVAVMKNLDSSDTVQVNNYLFDQNGISSPITIDLTGTDTGDAGLELLGQPLTSGGTSPHQMAADEGGNIEVIFSIKCNAGNSGQDLTFEEVFISGWKPADSSITVSVS